MSSRQAVLTQRTQIQRRRIQNDKVPRPGVVYPLQLLIYTVHITHDVRSWDLRICEQGIVAEVVRPDPDGVDRLVRRVDHELVAVRLDVLGVRDEGRDFVFAHCGEVKGREGPGCNFVAADGTADGVIVEVDASVLLDVFDPDAASTGRSVVLGVISPCSWRC